MVYLFHETILAGSGPGSFMRLQSGVQSLAFCLGPGNLLPERLTSHGDAGDLSSSPHLLLGIPHHAVAGSPRRVSSKTDNGGGC